MKEYKPCLDCGDDAEIYLDKTMEVKRNGDFVTYAKCAKCPSCGTDEIIGFTTVRESHLTPKGAQE